MNPSSSSQKLNLCTGTDCLLCLKRDSNPNEAELISIKSLSNLLQINLKDITGSITKQPDALDHFKRIPDSTEVMVRLCKNCTVGVNKIDLHLRSLLDLKLRIERVFRFFSETISQTEPEMLAEFKNGMENTIPAALKLGFIMDLRKEIMQKSAAKPFPVPVLYEQSDDLIHRAVTPPPEVESLETNGHCIFCFRYEGSRNSLKELLQQLEIDVASIQYRMFVGELSPSRKVKEGEIFATVCTDCQEGTSSLSQYLQGVENVKERVNERLKNIADSIEEADLDSERVLEHRERMSLEMETRLMFRIVEEMRKAIKEKCSKVAFLPGSVTSLEESHIQENGAVSTPKVTQERKNETADPGIILGKRVPIRKIKGDGEMVQKVVKIKKPKTKGELREARFSCPFCDKKFFFENEKNCHVLGKHRNNQFCCNICDQGRFQSLKSVRKHKKLCHSGSNGPGEVEENRFNNAK